MEALANSGLCNVFKWMSANGLNWSLIVSPQLQTTSTGNTNIWLDLKFNNVNIQPSTSGKYLGIMIDDKFKFKQHIIFLENKVARSVGIIAKLS